VQKSPEAEIAPGLDMANQRLRRKRRGHDKLPGHTDSPGVQHSSTAEIAAQQFLETCVHAGPSSLFQFNLFISLVYRNYIAGIHICQYLFSLFTTNP
jgi:hypothetical protein